MNMKRVSMGGLVATLLCLGVVRGQGLSPYQGAGLSPFSAPASQPAAEPAGPMGPAGPAEPAGPTGPAPLGAAHSSTWLDYQRCLGCCGPVGANGPIGYEVYLRNGFDFPLGGNPFGSRLNVGWDVTGGARTLFFDPAVDAAWAVDLSITNIHNTSDDRTTTYPLLNLPGATPGQVANVAVRALNRTYVNASVGREWYLWGCADVAKPETNWRVGVDVGGRYGTEMLEVTLLRHRTDTNAGLFLAVHSDVEVPWGCCIFQAGVRGEYGYTWSDILQRQTNSDIQDITLMFTLGTRF